MEITSDLTKKEYFFLKAESLQQFVSQHTHINNVWETLRS